VRIIGGDARGRRLRSVKGRTTRPTLARTRTALFDILAGQVRGSRFLDLFAGVGAVGLEALSRGAAAVAFVESGSRECEAIRGNLQSIGWEAQGRVICEPVEQALRGLSRRGEAFDLVFADPPYADAAAAERALAAVAARGLVAPEGTVVWQHSARTAPPAQVGGLALVRSHRAGDTCLTFYRTEEKAR
jgi:16S rRNA (guanine966-N2)-methyltransferase